AHYLQARYQLAPDDLIGLQLSRSEWLVTGILGILKAGCGYVPIDPNYPEDRIDYIKSDSRCKVVIDAAELAVFLDARLSFAETNPVQQASPGHLAYVIYTSGSTGLPKGVMIEHRQVISFFSNFHNSYLFEPGMVWGSVTNYTFDISVLEILGSLTGGIQLVLLSSTDPQGLIQEMRDKQVTILQLTPSRLSQLLESNDSAIAFLGDLKYLLVGGEALGQQHYDRLKELTGTRVLNMYGPTETTIWSSSLELQGSAALTIGKPLLHEATYIMDSHQQLCAIGITGEICIGGAGLARGYLYREELTAEKFIPHPYRAGERLYRTGDLGRWLADGMISFLGRNDDQVKIRGYRIEPGEIERALQTHPGVASAVVLAITSGNGSPEIVAYLLGTEPLQSTELRAHLQKHLPVYMLPEHYVQLDAFPLNASGKVDRKRLPSPQGLGLSAGREYIGPRNGTEAQLVQIWEEVLGRTGISIKDNFFELGGHSLKVTRL
ncbi:amino acid adenylation domain-containing protein, partial [[Flexibacter] sp. ATCC 35208]|uniref:non-ribosomal peptide synthetase n=1 Tax=[Flexibacter] sp. ATCC 35208 TaxID=1936242 RepID=UPI0009C70C51